MFHVLNSPERRARRAVQRELLTCAAREMVRAAQVVKGMSADGFEREV
jgi:hypothetical protein